jgi:hypothetical protein
MIALPPPATNATQAACRGVFGRQSKPKYTPEAYTNVKSTLRATSGDSRHSLAALLQMSRQARHNTPSHAEHPRAVRADRE